MELENINRRKKITVFMWRKILEAVVDLWLLLFAEVVIKSRKTAKRTRIPVFEIIFENKS